MRRDLEDDDDVVADGQSVHRPLMLVGSRRLTFDAADHQPGYRMTADARVRDTRREARAARQTWIRDMTSAWKRTPGRDAGPEPDAAEALLRRHLGTEPDEDAQARRDRTYADYCARISQAWQQTNPAARANSVERQRKQWTAER